MRTTNPDAVLQTQSPTTTWTSRLIIFAVLAAGLYGVSYQQFRHFKPEDSRGLSDSSSYLRMARGDYSGSRFHVYRFVTPAVARVVAAVLPKSLEHGFDKEVLAFYIVNYCFALTAVLFYFLLLKDFGFSDISALIGGLLFIASRIVVITTGAPLVDAVYFAAVAILLWLMQKDRFLLLVCLMPLLALSKETFLPFLFLPLFTRYRKSPLTYVSIIGSIALFFTMRYLVTDWMGIEHRDLAKDTTKFVKETLFPNLTRLFTPSGVFDLLNGFSFLLPLGICGFFINKKHKLYPVPRYLLLIVMIGLGYGILNGNLGRMFFVSYPAVITYAVIAIVYALDPVKKLGATAKIA